MAPSPQELKAALRQEVRKRIAGLSEENRRTASARACTLLEQQVRCQRANSLLCYAPMPGELDVWPFLAKVLEAGKLVALPCFDAVTERYIARRVKNLAQDVKTGHLGIREPRMTCDLVALNRLDFILAPGVAFDLQGRRLGRGRGFYDQLLAEVLGTTCGVAFDEQIVREVPVEPHDSDVNCILTPTRWLEL